MNKEIIYDSPLIIKYHNFLTYDECKSIIDAIDAKEYDKATVYSVPARDYYKSEGRTNSTYVDRTKKLLQLEIKITDFINTELNAINGKNTQYNPETPLAIQKYGVGEQYKVHVDYFNNTEKVHNNDRLATCILYLNDDFEGGHTFFKHLNISIKPKSGMILFFKYDSKYSHENYKTLHAGLPVESGTKYIISAFIREGSIPDWKPTVSDKIIKLNHVYPHITA